MYIYNIYIYIFIFGGDFVSLFIPLSQLFLLLQDALPAGFDATTIYMYIYIYIYTHYSLIYITLYICEPIYLPSGSSSYSS